MSAFLQATATFSTGYKLGCTWCCFAPLCPYSRVMHCCNVTTYALMWCCRVSQGAWRVMPSHDM